MNGKDRIEQLQDSHSWLTEEEARFILMTRYFTFTRDLKLTGDTLRSAMDNCVLIYTRLPEEDMRSLLSRVKEAFANNQFK